MSTQPSTMENVRAGAATATHAIAETIDPEFDRNNAVNGDKNKTRDAQGTVVQKGSYKDQLNRAAHGSKVLNKEESLLDKAASMIPGMDQVIGSKKEQKASLTVVDDGTPPTRPEHDTQVEEFLKDQYHTRSGDGMEDANKS